MHDPLLKLRDIHQSPAPSWWPPAPGWWIVVAVLLVAFGTLMWLQWRRRQRRRAIVRMFDDSVRDAGSPAAQVAAMSELLRRAARRRDPAADRLDGEAWLLFLDRGAKRPLFADASGRLLLEGGFRRALDADADADADAVAALLPRARTRFLEWTLAK